MTVTPALRDWLTRAHDVAPDGSAADRVADPVAERLLSLTRPLRPRVAMVAGALVVHAPAGMPFAAAVDGELLVRIGTAAASLASTPAYGLDGWRVVDPWPDDVAFRRGTDELRDLLARACDESVR
jgi:hypothetical protein